MAVPTLSLFLAAVAEHAGTCFGQLCVRHPRATHALLRTLERAGLRQAGWALLALEIHLGNGAAS